VPFAFTVTFCVMLVTVRTAACLGCANLKRTRYDFPTGPSTAP
jgi:hypothetical protein